MSYPLMTGLTTAEIVSKIQFAAAVDASGNWLSTLGSGGSGGSGTNITIPTTTTNHGIANWSGTAGAGLLDSTVTVNGGTLQGTVVSGATVIGNYVNALTSLQINAVDVNSIFVHQTGDTMTGGLNGTSASFTSITGTTITSTTNNSVQYQTTLSSGTVPLGVFTQSIDFNSGTSSVWNLLGTTGNVAFSFKNGIAGSTYSLQTINNTTGTTTATFTGAIKWAGGITGTLTASGNAVDLFPLYYNGVNYLAAVSNNYF